MDTEQTGPLLVAAVVIAILVLLRPLSGTLVGIPMNWVGVIFVAVGGLVGAFGE